MGDNLNLQKKTNRSFVKVLMLFVVTFAIQILTVIKSSIVASSFGTSEAMDAYNFVNSIVLFVFSVVSAGISTIIIPEYSNKRDRSVADTFITAIYGGCLLVCVVLIVFRYQLVNLLSNKGESFSETAANVMVILVLSQYFISFGGIITAFFQCENKPVLPKVFHLICNSIIIAVLAYICDSINIYEYAAIISFGNILCFIFEMVYALRRGWRFKPSLSFNDQNLLLFKRFAPVVFSGGVYQLSLLCDSMIATNLSTGMITILGYSTQISSIANSLVVGNLLIYIYPKIARNAQTSGFQSRFWEQTRGLHVIVCLVIAGFVCVGKEAVFVLLNRGKFSAEACEIVFYAATIYIFGQGISILRDMIYRYFYAVGNTKTPAQNSILVSACNITISLILVELVGFYGIVLGTVAASLISLIVIMVRFHKMIGFSSKVLQITNTFIKNFAIMLMTIVLVYATKQMLPIANHLLSMFVFGIETVVVYAVIQYVINKKALVAIMNL